MGFFAVNNKELNIKKVKVLGIRSVEQTKLFATYNASLYSLLILYEDGSRDLVECESKELQKKYLAYIEV